MQETEVRLVEVCRDYCQEVWAEVFNLAGVLAAWKWRKAENIYYPPDICKVPDAHPPPAAPAPTSFKQPFITQAFLPPPKVPKGPARLVIKAKGLR